MRVDKSLLKMIPLVFITHWLTKSLFSYINIQANILIYLIFVLLFSQILTYFFTKLIIKEIIIIPLFVLLRFIFDKSIYSLKFLKEFFFIVLLYIVIRVFVIKLANEVFSYDVPISFIKPGMILNQRIIKQNDKYVAISLDDAQLKKGEPLLEEDMNDSLSENDIKIIKSAYRKNLLNFNNVKVSRYYCFAPYLFIATIIVIITQGGFFYYISSLF